MREVVYVEALGYTWKIRDLRASNYHPTHLTPAVHIAPVRSPSDPTPVTCELLRPGLGGGQSVTLSVCGPHTRFDPYEDVHGDAAALRSALQPALQPVIDDHRQRYDTHLANDTPARQSKLTAVARFWGLAD